MTMHGKFSVCTPKIMVSTIYFINFVPVEGYSKVLIDPKVSHSQSYDWYEIQLTFEQLKL